MNSNPDINNKKNQEIKSNPDIAEFESKDPVFSLKNIIIYTCLCVILCCTTFAYTALRILKDALVQKYAPAVTLNFIKAWIMTPVAFICPLLLSILARRVRHRSRFYYQAGFFFISYLIIYILLPYCEILQSSYLGVRLRGMGLGDFGDGLGCMFGYWMFALFTVTTEVFGMIAIPMMAWGTINDNIPNIAKSKRDLIYNIFTGISNLFSLLSALWVRSLSRLKGLEFIQRSRYLIFWLSLVSIGVMLIAYIILNFANNNLKDKKDGKEKITKETDRSPYGLVISEPYYRYIAFMVAGYNICIMAVDFFSKPAIKAIVGPEGWSNYQGSAYALNSIASIFISLLNATIFRHLSLGARSLLPVLMMGLTGALFFVYYIVAGQWEMAAALFSFIFSVLPQYVMCLMVVGQLVGSKAAKYTGFDAAKEAFMAQIVMSERFVVKGVIDSAANRVAKSGFSLFTLILLFLATDLGSLFSAPLLAIIAVLGLFYAPYRRFVRKHLSVIIPISSLLFVGILGYTFRSYSKATNTATVQHVQINKKSLERAEKLTAHESQNPPIASDSDDKNKMLPKKNKEKIKSVENVEDQKDLKKIAPIVFAIFLAMVGLWAWSLSKIYPMYQERIGTKANGIFLWEYIVMTIATIVIFAFIILFISDFLDALQVIKTKIPTHFRMTYWIERLTGINIPKALLIEGLNVGG